MTIAQLSSHCRVLVAAVDKSTTNPELRFFNNCFGDGFDEGKTVLLPLISCLYSFKNMMNNTRDRESLLLEMTSQLAPLSTDTHSVCQHHYIHIIFPAISDNSVLCPGCSVTLSHSLPLLTELVWKVGRYTSASPIFFGEFENYVDGGVLANNPCDCGLTAIQNFYRLQGERLLISMVVSIGTGQYPPEVLGKVDAQVYMYT